MMDMPTTKSTLIIVSKDQWDTKEGTGKSMKNALHVQWYGQKHLSGWSNVKQQKNQTLAIIEFEGMQSVRQLVRQ